MWRGPLACGIENRLDAYLGIRLNYKRAPRQVSMRHARVRAPQFKVNVIQNPVQQH